ncbi:MAG: hypothetical protein NC181_04515 [Clostridium sp.]|nr:hypothetical protein [Clostridium sp.]MCM1444562.1 hypothetical protein [Candidatus Amulumruptor caecigallinarius]
MKKLLPILIIFIVGCSKNTLTCTKTNYSTIYGKETIEEIYIFKNNKLTDYTVTKMISFEDSFKKYINNIYEYYKEEANIINENIKGSKSTTKYDSFNVYISTNVDIKNSNESIELLNVDKNVSFKYIKSTLTQNGYLCSISN